jgi:hypothetical protein
VVPPLASADLTYVVSGALLKRSHHGPGMPQKGYSEPSSLRRWAARTGAK